MDFRKLRANEIDCRVKVVKSNGCSVLLYKDARVDQKILDETVGPMNWQRKHTRDNANCVVSIWDSSKSMWVEKEDTGTESNTEAEKGLASDSFKRACFNWGIGRELYTAPFIWIKNYSKDETGKIDDRFKVSSIAYDEDGNICDLVIKNKDGKVAYTMNSSKNSTEKKVTKKQAEPKRDERIAEADTKAKVLSYINKHYDANGIKEICKYYRVASLSNLDMQRCQHYLNQLELRGGSIND